MNRITKTFLKAQVDRINRVTGSPLQYNGTMGANIGHYTLSGAYGGFSLLRVETEGGGVSDVFRCGHVTKRSLSNMMDAFLCGIASVKPVE
jgi:hypothetical protein